MPENKRLTCGYEYYNCINLLDNFKWNFCKFLMVCVYGWLFCIRISVIVLFIKLSMRTKTPPQKN